MSTGERDLSVAESRVKIVEEITSKTIIVSNFYSAICKDIFKEVTEINKRIENEEELNEVTAEIPIAKRSKIEPKGSLKNYCKSSCEFVFIQALKYEDVYLRAIPRAGQYEKSFMHRDIITHVIATEFAFLQ